MNVLFTNGLLANLRESIRRKHSVNGNVVRFMWHRLVGRLPGPADRYHARSDRTVFKCPIVPSSATPQTESLMIDGKSGNDDQSSVFSTLRAHIRCCWVPADDVCWWSRRCWSDRADRGCCQARSNQYPCLLQAVERVRGSLNRKAPAALVSSTFRYPWMRMRPPW